MSRKTDPSLAFDIVSYGRRGPMPHRLLPKHIEQIRRTLRRAPEVMIKVTSGSGATSTRGVAAHISYIGRRGRQDIETDNAARLSGSNAPRTLIRDWDLDLLESRSRGEAVLNGGRRPTKLVHRLVFSMPPGTHPKKVLAAVRDFAAAEFAQKHRYAMVLHTDEPHPHVHVVVKAVSEEGVRLNIRKETLRRWRSDFAYHLRRHGVEANATSRASRGEGKFRKLDGIYRAAARGSSTHMRQRAEQAIRESRSAERDIGDRLRSTRSSLIRAWRALMRELASHGDRQLNVDIREYVRSFPQAKTEAEILRERVRTRHAEVHDRPIRNNGDIDAPAP